jgi:hypothetical protein
LRWGLKKIYSPHWDLSNSMWRTTCTKGNWSDSWLLVVESQMGNLTPDPSFGHNLCFKKPNGSWEPILDIYVPRAFQWYKKSFNPMGFDPWNCSLNIQDSNSQSGSSFRNVGFISSHSSTLLGAWMWLPGFIFDLHLCKPLPWNPRLRLWQFPSTFVVGMFSKHGIYVVLKKSKMWKCKVESFKTFMMWCTCPSIMEKQLMIAKNVGGLLWKKVFTNIGLVMHGQITYGLITINLCDNIYHGLIFKILL